MPSPKLRALCKIGHTSNPCISEVPGELLKVQMSRPCLSAVVRICGMRTQALAAFTLSRALQYAARFENRWLTACSSDFSARTDHGGTSLEYRFSLWVLGVAQGSDKLPGGGPGCWSRHHALSHQGVEEKQKVRMPGAVSKQGVATCHIRLLSTWNVASKKLSFTFYLLLVHLNLKTAAVWSVFAVKQNSAVLVELLHLVRHRAHCCGPGEQVYLLLFQCGY